MDEMDADEPPAVRSASHWQGFHHSVVFSLVPHFSPCMLHPFLISMNDDQLHRLLRDSPAQLPLPGSFTREVWTRIEAEETTSVLAALPQACNALLGSLSRPVPAFATIAACMLLGGGFGWMMHREASDTRGELAYAESINPFLRTEREVSR
jgi:hypothetical protein